MSFNNAAYPPSPTATAIVKGNRSHPELYGVVLFYQMPFGVIVNAQFRGLPVPTEENRNQFLGFHIHENGNCSQNTENDFHLTGNHYNPEQLSHPNHRGDLVPLLNCHGQSWQTFLADAFNVPEIIGRSIVVHASFDDFTTQPSGNSGAKIACGIIKLND